MNTDNTPSNDQQDQDALRQEQQQIPALQNEDGRAPAPQPEPETPKPAEEEKPETEKVDPRAARMESLANRAHERTTDELTQSREAIVEPVAPKPETEVQPAAQPERKLKLKIRGEEVEMTEAEVIARAQRVEAGDQYLSEARNLLEEAKRTARPAATAEAPAPKPTAEKIDRIAEAIEKIQTGADPAEARALLDTEISERARDAARTVLDEDRTTSAVQQFDDEVDQGYEGFRKDHEVVAKDPIASSVVVAVTGGLEGEIIARYLEGPTGDAVRAAFTQAGITAEGVRKYSPQDAHSLYKDMVLKGFPFPRPSDTIRAAGKTVAERFAATTRTDPTPQPSPKPTPSVTVSVNREQRKETLQQPERASIPTRSGGTPPPQTESERTTSARTELRAARRGGAGR